MPWPANFSKLRYDGLYDAFDCDYRKGLREDETISIQPMWVLGIEGHEFVEENMSDWSQPHRGSGVAGVRLEGGIDLLMAICCQKVLFRSGDRKVENC